jgi:hypothetical protein
MTDTVFKVFDNVRKWSALLSLWRHREDKVVD